MRILAPILIFALFLPLSAGAGSIPLGQPFTLEVGESVNVGDEPINVRFDKILSDSRCPLDVFCFWEGEATAQIHLSTMDNDGETAELHTQGSPFGASSTEYRQLVITLLDVGPEPYVRDPIDPTDYKIQLRVDLTKALPTEASTWSVMKARFK